MAEPESEVEGVVPLEEELALLGEEEGEAGEVGAPRVHLRLREVGVRGELHGEVGGRLPVDVDTRLEVVVGGGVAVFPLLAEHQRGADRDPGAEVEGGQAGEPSRAARLRHLPVEARARPAVGLQQSLHAPLDVEVPAVDPFAEAQRSDRQAELDAPPRLVDRRRCLPHSVPRRVLSLAAARDERVVARAAGVHHEDVAGASVLPGAEDETHVILAAQPGVAGDGVADDLVGAGIVAADPEHQLLRIREHPHLGCERRGRALVGIDHGEILDRVSLRPRGLVEDAVEGQLVGKCADAQRAPALHFSRSPRNGAGEEHQKGAGQGEEGETGRHCRHFTEVDYPAEDPRASKRSDVPCSASLF